MYNIGTLKQQAKNIYNGHTKQAIQKQLHREQLIVSLSRIYNCAKASLCKCACQRNQK